MSIAIQWFLVTGEPGPTDQPSDAVVRPSLCNHSRQRRLDGCPIRVAQKRCLSKKSIVRSQASLAASSE